MRRLLHHGGLTGKRVRRELQVAETHRPLRTNSFAPLPFLCCYDGRDLIVQETIYLEAKSK